MSLNLWMVFLLHCFASIVWLCVADVALRFRFSVYDWRKCEIGNDAVLVFRNIPVQECLLECRVRGRCKAVKFLTIRRECGLMKTAVTMVTEYTSRPCVFIRMSDVEDISPVSDNCRNCSENEVCDIVTRTCNKEVTCNHNWLKTKESCYLFSQERKTFADAQEYCSSYDSHLIHIETSTENAVINRHLNSYYKHTNYKLWWIGITGQFVSDCEWKWNITNTVAKFEDWGPSEPDNNRDREHCAVISLDIRPGWHDVNCAQLFYPICEKRV